MATKLNWASFEQKLSSWSRVIKPGFQEGLLDEVFAHLKKRNKESVVYPSSEYLWKPFQLCAYDKLKLVVACEGPYLGEEGDGLALSCTDWNSPLKCIEPLEAFYSALEKELYEGLCLQCVFQNDLSYLARQGVLLLNIPLTGDKEGSHTELWHPFIQYLFQETISYTGVPVLFLGQSTFRYEEQLCPWQERFKLSYPKKDWGSEGVFKKINQVIKETNNEEIEWAQMLPF